MMTPDEKYLVVSPQISRVEPILDDGTGPTEHFACVCEVEAANKREARQRAIHHPDMREWVQWQQDNGACPFTGLTATVVE